MTATVSRTSRTAGPETEIAAPESPALSLLAEDLAQGCREVAELLITGTGPDLFVRLAPLLQGMADAVHAVNDGNRASGTPIAAVGRQGDPLTGRPEHPPKVGRSGTIRLNSSPVRSFRNVVAPPARLSRLTDRSRLHVRLSNAYQGPPRIVQGGYCAVLLDDVMWDAVHVVRPGIAFTRTLEIGYLRPVPVDQELTVDGWVVEVAGRKIFAEGAICTADGEVLTTAKGLWITPAAPATSPARSAAAAP